MTQLSVRKCEVRLINLKLKYSHNFDTLKRRNLKHYSDINFVFKYKNAITVLDKGLRAIRNAIQNAIRNVIRDAIQSTIRKLFGTPFRTTLEKPFETQSGLSFETQFAMLFKTPFKTPFGTSFKTLFLTLFRTPFGTPLGTHIFRFGLIGTMYLLPFDPTGFIRHRSNIQGTLS